MKGLRFNRWTKETSNGTLDRFYVSGLGVGADLAKFYIEEIKGADLPIVKWNRSIMSEQTGGIYADDIYAELATLCGDNAKWSDLLALCEEVMA